MPKRSLSSRSLRFSSRRTRDNSSFTTFSPANLDGKNLLDMFEDWSRNTNSIPLMEDGSDHCIKIKKILRISNETLFIDAFAGKRGEYEEIYDAKTSESIGRISPEQAAAGHTRAILYVPSRGEVALFFSEHCQRGCAGKQILERFIKHFRTITTSIIIKSEVMLEGEDWLEHIRALKQIEMKRYALPDDNYSEISELKGVVSLTMKPEKRGIFPANILPKLRGGKISPNAILGFPNFQCDDVFVTAQMEDGRTKTFDINDYLDAPRFLRTLSERNENELSDDEFVKKCKESAETILNRLGQN